MKKTTIGIALLLMCINYSAAQNYESFPLIQARWGQGNGEFGLRMEAEGHCPQSISVDERGNIAILDAVNSRVQLFSALGNWLKNITVSVQGFDVQYVENKIYVLAPYDYCVEELDFVGKTKNQIEIDKKIDLIDVLRVNNNQVWVQTYEQKQYRLDESIPMDRQMQTERTGMSGRSPHLSFQTRWHNERQGEVRIKNEQTNKTQSITINTTDKLGSIIFLDTDKNGFIYLRLEIFGENGESFFEVQKLSPEGDVISNIQIPNDNIVMPYRPLTVDSEGNIYFMQIHHDGFTVLKWRITN